MRLRCKVRAIVYVLGIPLILFSLAKTQAWAASRFASPTGSGTTCSSTSPCTLNTALSQAVAGDTVQLKNGTYTQTNTGTVRSGTVSQPITIRAENPRQATIRFAGTSGNTARIFGITHSNIILKDLVFDGNGWSWDGIRINCSASSPCSNIIVENNRVTNTGGKAIGAHHYASNIVIRWNDLDNIDPAGGATYTGNNTPFYMGTANPLAADDLVSNVEIYANTVTLATQTTGENLLDQKGNTRNFYVHHNIFEGLVDGNDGCVSMGANTGGHNHRFEDNIIRNSDCGSAVFDYTKTFGNQTIKRNVVRVITDGSFIWYREGFGLANTVVSDNTLCTASTLVEQRNGGGISGPIGFTTSGNAGAASSVCDSQEARILTEKRVLPGNPNGSAENIAPASPSGLISTALP